MLYKHNSADMPPPVIPPVIPYSNLFDIEFFEYADRQSEELNQLNQLNQLASNVLSVDADQDNKTISIKFSEYISVIEKEEEKYKHEPITELKQKFQLAICSLISSKQKYAFHKINILLHTKTGDVVAQFEFTGLSVKEISMPVLDFSKQIPYEPVVTFTYSRLEKKYY